MRFSLGCSLGYDVKVPTPFVFNVELAKLASQTIVSETLTLSPDCATERWTMPETGNRYIRITAPPGRFTLDYQAEVDLMPALEDPDAVTEVAAADIPLPTLVHLYPSRYCQSDKLQRLANRTFGAEQPGYARVTAICNWIHDNVDYVGGVSDELTSAFDTATERAGVCRDFAHLAISFCRALGIPARYVSAYAWRLDPPDFHAVIEAYLQGPNGPGWYLCDPTRKAAADGLARIGVARDAAEVAFASPFGAVDYDKPEVWIRALGPEQVEPPTTLAIRAE
ncbi:transglutaminase family protein [Lichenihabitans sp. Uapishka_5]|uniref:transglutaminase-like domain-containing protein n=1 Tax=Lichenihabitans sp. Uapishka_5 TaxID=3037302 RepID=UPI0029E7D3F6|nr:transglutaminase family protein [Lichenihabitans sp. Uapishka_5]MDX7952847.1 transglutaminase family protein [Lichenihabitans sp. Uapishka_5]